MFVKIKNMEDNRFFYNQHDIKQWYVKKIYTDTTAYKSAIYMGGVNSSIYNLQFCKPTTYTDNLFLRLSVFFFRNFINN